MLTPSECTGRKKPATDVRRVLGVEGTREGAGSGSCPSRAALPSASKCSRGRAFRLSRAGGGRGSRSRAQAESLFQTVSLAEQWRPCFGQTLKKIFVFISLKILPVPNWVKYCTKTVIIHLTYKLVTCWVIWLKTFRNNFGICKATWFKNDKTWKRLIDPENLLVIESHLYVENYIKNNILNY